MTAAVRILTTRTVDSSPAILLVDPNGSKTLINCGEGSQRSFLELSQKLSSVDRVCLTHLSHDAVGGLPGMILSSADAAKATQVHQMAQKAGIAQANNNNSSSTLGLVGLELIGPKGIKPYLRSLRHFVRRDDFPLTIREGIYCQAPVNTTLDTSSSNRKKKRKRQENKEDTATITSKPSYFGVQTIPIPYQIPNPNNRRLPKFPTEVVSFVFTTPPVAGKFLPNKAKELGIPPGPLYAQLKNGKTITFTNKEGKEQIVESSQVVLEPSPAMMVAVLYYPALQVWNTLQPKLDDMIGQQSSCQLELVIHMTTKSILEDPVCQTWRKQFTKDKDNNSTRHIFLETSDPATWTPPAKNSPSPYTSACIGALLRSKLSSSVYATPDYLQLQQSTISATGSEPAPSTTNNRMIQEEDNNMSSAMPLMEYILLPLVRKGFNEELLVSTTPSSALADRTKEGMELLEKSGALEVAKEVLANSDSAESNNNSSSSKAELLFTGTGSAIPCKHRNVTGACLRNEDGQGMLLDVGEGTVGQLLRTHSSSSAEDQLCTIKVAWVSHPHADHHLGLVRLLTERQAVLDQRGGKSDPLLVIGPPPVLDFLKEYEQIDPRIESSYVSLDCRQVQNKGPNNNERPLPRLIQENSFLRGRAIEAIQVTHCPYSYAVVVDGTSFGRVAYSGDCRPSSRFAERARDADILIHEATFEIGMEAEAAMKRHSTVGEALKVAQDMRAKHLVLTHFSQRYPKISPLIVNGQNGQNTSNTTLPVIFAFDYMGLTPTNLDVASKLTPSLRCLYPEEEGGGGSEKNNEASAMSIPGFFTQNPY